MSELILNQEVKSLRNELRVEINNIGLTPVVIHLSGILFGIVPSMIAYFTLRENKFAKENARNALNFHISVTLYGISVILLSAAILFVLFWNRISLVPVATIVFYFGLFSGTLLFWLLNCGFSIVGGIKAKQNLLYEYPISIEFIK